MAPVGHREILREETVAKAGFCVPGIFAAWNLARPHFHRLPWSLWGFLGNLSIPYNAAIFRHHSLCWYVCVFSHTFCINNTDFLYKLSRTKYPFTCYKIFPPALSHLVHTIPFNFHMTIKIRTFIEYWISFYLYYCPNFIGEETVSVE